MTDMENRDDNVEGGGCLPSLVLPRPDADLIVAWALRILALAGDIECGRYQGRRITKSDIRSCASEIEGRADCIVGLIEASFSRQNDQEDRTRAGDDQS
jgi:hypothetical protein